MSADLRDRVIAVVRGALRQHVDYVAGINTIVDGVMAIMSDGSARAAHDCAAWRMEGIGCAQCNPIARALGQAWLPVDDAVAIKRCPQCFDVALEGETVCTNCGAEPTDDKTWRT